MRGLDVLEDNKFDSAQEKTAVTAFISESRDRESNKFYRAAICDNEKNEIIKELSDYDREELEKEVLQQFPNIEIENA
jgi:hypothetical protein